MNTDYIEIDMDQMVVYSKGEVIAKVKTLQNGEFIIISTSDDAQRRFCISKDRAYIFSEAGSTWQRRRSFKNEWTRRQKAAGWQGHVPLPFQEIDPIYLDTDNETKQQCLKDDVINPPSGQK